MSRFRDCTYHGALPKASPAEDRLWRLGARKQRAFLVLRSVKQSANTLREWLLTREPFPFQTRAKESARSRFVWEEMVQLIEVGTQCWALLSRGILGGKWVSGWEVAVLAKKMCLPGLSGERWHGVPVQGGLWREWENLGKVLMKEH